MGYDADLRRKLAGDVIAFRAFFTKI